MSHFKLSAFADEYAVSFEEQLRGLTRFGIDHMEIRHVNGQNISVLTMQEVKEARKMLNSFGIKVSAVGSPIGKIRLDGDMAAHMDMAKRVCEAANILGAPYIRMFSFYGPDGQDIAHMKSQVLDALNELVALAREYGVILCHENEAKI